MGIEIFLCFVKLYLIETDGLLFLSSFLAVKPSALTSGQVVGIVVAVFVVASVIIGIVFVMLDKHRFSYIADAPIEEPK